MSQNISCKLKILALHGYMQSAEKFKDKTYPFCGKVKKYADFLYISAPYSVFNEFVGDDKFKTEDNANNSVQNDLGIQDSKDTDFYAWYLRHFNETNKSYTYEGLEETLNYLDKIFEERGPFDGVFGFSQGGCLVGILCDLQQRKLTKHIKFDFAIIACGFKYPEGEFYKDKLEIPSLHIYGENDKQIPSDWSENLIECFKTPVVVKHSGGHYVPGNSTLRRECEPFLKDRWSRKFEKSKECI